MKEQITLNEIKQLTEADYQEVFALSQFAFQYELSEAALVAKEAEAKRHVIWGCMDNGQLAAKLHLIPLSCYINGKQFQMGGVSSVATWPEYRRQGLVKQLLRHGLKQMKRNGQTISFLHPFSVPFYRKYGWEIAFTEKHYLIPVEKMKGNWHANGYVRRVQKNTPLLNKIYTAYAESFTGMLVRDGKWWEQRVLKDKPHIAVAYNEADQAEGYVMYDVKENIFTVKDMAYTSTNGWKLLLQFIANHDSMTEQVKMIVPENDNLPLLVDEPRFEQKVVPYFMARVIDVLSFLNAYPFAANVDAVLSIHVKDAFFPENNGTYQLNPTGQITHSSQMDSEHGIHCTIQLLTSMFLGYKRPMELYQVGLIQGEQEEIEQLEKTIPKQQTFFADFF